MIIVKRCPYCNKRVEIISELDLGTSKLLTFRCNHTVVEIQLSTATNGNLADYTALDGSKLLPYQIEGVDFIFRSQAKCLLSDEMRLGKTVQSLVALATKKDELLPAIVICKAIAKVDWLRQTINWGKVIAQIVDGSKSTFFEKYKIHIISLDLLPRLKDNPSFKVIAERAKTIIIDECHLIKNQTAKRTVAAKKLVHETGISKYTINLSATPIENNAAEYFPVLNIVRPELFHNFTTFCENYVYQYYDSRGNAWKYGGLKNPELFKVQTKDFILRRTIDEVMPQIPKVWRQFHYIDLDVDINIDGTVYNAQKIYDKEWKEFTDFFDENEGNKSLEFYSNVMAKMARLRHLTGLAKIDFCLDNLMEFLGGNNRKIVVYVHHKDVGQTLFDRLKEICTELNLTPSLRLRAEDTGKAQAIIDDFRDGTSRVLIASTQAAGASIDLQFCADFIMHERQWNSSKEDQAGVGRCRGLLQKAERINLSFLVAVGTIDEYFAEIVERKRQIFEEAMSGKTGDFEWNESSIIRELAEILAKKGREKWSIHS